jgi:hypothetical protein
MSPLTAGQALPRADLGRTPRALGCGGFDFMQIVGRELDVHGADVLAEPLEPPRTRNRHDPRLLRQQPRERDLRRCCLLARRDGVEELDQRLIRLECLGREPGQRGAEVGAVELRGLVRIGSSRRPSSSQPCAEWALCQQRSPAARVANRVDDGGAARSGRPSSLNGF